MNYKKTYRKISYTIFFMLFAYILSGQLIIKYNLNKNVDFTFFTFCPKLEIRANILKIELKNQTKLIELKFKKPLESVMSLNRSEDKFLKYDIKLGPEKEWLSISSKNQSLQGVPVDILLSKPEKGGYLKRRIIENIKVDNEEFNISRFYYKYLSKYSNLKIYYPMYLPNISSFLAEYFGELVVVMILGVLWLFFVCQIVIMAISIIIQPEEVKEYFNDSDQGSAITFIDSIAERFAIPLGFLGTVVSIWASLELSETDYQSFVQILEIIKIAVFTTVLGLATKVICLIRSRYKGFLIKINEAINERH